LAGGIYQTWFNESLCTPRDWAREANSINGEYIRKVVNEELYEDSHFAPIFAYLYQVLTALGMEFYSPGGSLQRREWVLLAQLFGFREPSGYLKKVEVRVVLDLLANEVLKRRGTQSKLLH
jgi:hypothetical protein